MRFTEKQQKSINTLDDDLVDIVKQTEFVHSRESENILLLNSGGEMTLSRFIIAT